MELRNYSNKIFELREATLSSARRVDFIEEFLSSFLDTINFDQIDTIWLKIWIFYQHYFCFENLSTGIQIYLRVKCNNLFAKFRFIIGSIVFMNLQQ